MSDEGPGEPGLVRPDDAPAGAIVRVFRVAPEHAKMRVDVFLQSQLRNTSRTRARAIVEKSAFSPDGRRLKPSERLRAEDRVVLWRAPLEDDEPTGEIPIIYEDDDLLVVDKPPLVTVHPTARYHKSTLIEQLKRDRPGEYLSLVHRLDRETSGIVLVARSAEADRAFKRIVEDRSTALADERAGRRTKAPALGKTYLAITWSEPPATTIDLPLEPDVDNPLRVKMRVAEPGSGLEARTGVEVLERRPGYALVRCELYTGRQHQIRVHLAALGCPVVGDKLYGPDERMLARGADGELSEEDLEKLELPRHALHAHRYRITHAISGKELALESPLPEDLARFWAGLPH